MAPKKSKSNASKGKIDDLLKRSVFYAVCMFVLYQVLLIPLQERDYPLFWVLSVVGYVIVLLELFFSRKTDQKIQFVLSFNIFKSSRKTEHMIHHIVLPSLMYLSGVLFLFFNRIRALDQVAIVILTVVFMLLFYNISCAYRRKYSVTRRTRYVFDFINIIIFYFSVDVLVNLVFYNGWSKFIIYIGSGIMTVFLIWLMLVITRQISRVTIFSTVFSGLVVAAASFLAFMIPVFNIAVIALVIAVVFYLVDVYWYHKLEGTFNWDIMLQYALFGVMAVILLLYI
ncbi:hypothetical protein JW710_03060 [Candidatus Dojkabacteria bacterium]|nr:hypothetical protein [Candidatus Dojkabacteria bacterium]